MTAPSLQARPTPPERLAALSDLITTTRGLMEAAGTTGLATERIQEAERLLTEATHLLGEQPRSRVHRPSYDKDWAERALSGEPLRLAPFNPLCIPLEVVIQGQRATAAMTPGALHEGPPDHLHGGFSAAILDHVLGFLIFAQGTPAVTARLDLTYLKAIVLDEPIEITGEITSVDGRKVRAEAWISQRGVAVEARGLFIHIAGRELSASD